MIICYCGVYMVVHVAIVIFQHRDGSLGEDVGCILFRGHLVDENNTVVVVAADEGLPNTEMLGGGVVHLFRALQVHASVVSALASSLRLPDPQLM